MSVLARVLGGETLRGHSKQLEPHSNAAQTRRERDRASTCREQKALGDSIIIATGTLYSLRDPFQDTRVGAPISII